MWRDNLDHLKADEVTLKLILVIESYELDLRGYDRNQWRARRTR
jgi:hypothetical protein